LAIKILKKIIQNLLQFQQKVNKNPPKVPEEPLDSPKSVEKILLNRCKFPKSSKSVPHKISLEHEKTGQSNPKHILPTKQALESSKSNSDHTFKKSE
jgi:hypothetical protein